MDLCGVNEIREGDPTRENKIFGYSGDCLMVFLRTYFQRTRILDYATNVTLMLDEGTKFTKGLLVFGSTEKHMPVERSVLVWISRAKESSNVAETFLRSFRLDAVLPYFAALNMSIHIAGDLKSLYLITGLKGAVSKYPCILCHTQRLKRKGNGYLNLQNKLEFYEAGNPILISNF